MHNRRSFSLRFRQNNINEIRRGGHHLDPLEVVKLSVRHGVKSEGLRSDCANSNDYAIDLGEEETEILYRYKSTT